MGKWIAVARVFAWALTVPAAVLIILTFDEQTKVYLATNYSAYRVDGFSAELHRKVGRVNMPLLQSTDGEYILEQLWFSYPKGVPRETMMEILADFSRRRPGAQEVDDRVTRAVISESFVPDVRNSSGEVVEAPAINSWGFTVFRQRSTLRVIGLVIGATAISGLVLQSSVWILGWVFRSAGTGDPQR